MRCNSQRKLLNKPFLSNEKKDSKELGVLHGSFLKPSIFMPFSLAIRTVDKNERLFHVKFAFKRAKIPNPTYKFVFTLSSSILIAKIL